MSGSPSAAVLTRVRRRFVAGDGGAEDVERSLVRLLHDEDPLLDEGTVRRSARLLAEELVGLGPLGRLLEDPSVTDVLVNGPGPVWVERAGRLERTGVVVDRAAIDRWVERVVGPLGLQADRSRPVVDARLPDGTRVAVVLPPLAVDGPLLAIRRHRATVLPLSAFAGPAVAALLARLVTSRRNLVVYGPTGSGKTSLVGSLIAAMPPGERVVTVEDVAELRLPGDHVVRLEARPGTADGAGAVAVRELVRAALRLRPDRLVVGEVRGPEALDMVWALSTGHRGSLSTCHAADPHDVLRRLETMCCGAPERLPLDAVRTQVRAAVDVVVGLRRLPDGRRAVVAVHEVADDDGRLVDLCAAS